jgi:hypothetical protein
MQPATPDLLISGLKLPEDTAAAVSGTSSLLLLVLACVVLLLSGAIPIMPPLVVHPASKALRQATASNRPRVEDFARIFSPPLFGDD